jgi:hypothetical protein
MVLYSLSAEEVLLGQCSTDETKALRNFVVRTHCLIACSLKSRFQTLSTATLYTHTSMAFFTFKVSYVYMAHK